jgi:hypothetical protein
MPLDPKLTKYSTAAQQLINIDLQDALENQSYLTLFGGKTADRTLLSSIAFYSNELNQTTIPGAATANDVDFDQDINITTRIEGRGFVTVPLFHVAGNSGPLAVNTTLTVKLRHWDGASETEIVSENATANPAANVAQNALLGQVWTVDFDIPNTLFNRGDTLRITVETTAPQADSEIIICHDPKDRDAPNTNSVGASGGGTTQPDITVLQALIPVVVDL